MDMRQQTPHRHQGSVHSAHSFCPFIQETCSKRRCERLPLKTAVVCARQVLLVMVLLASSSLRVARTRKSVMSATRPKPNALSTSKSPIEHAIGTNKRCKMTMPCLEELFEERALHRSNHLRSFLIPSGERPERNALINFVFFRALSEYPSPIMEALRVSLRCVCRELIIVIIIVRLHQDDFQ